jgi:predicted dehydrogenase
LIDLARYATGDAFAEVCAHSLTTLHGEKAIETLIRTEDERAGIRNDDSCAFLCEFKSGAQGVFHTSWVAYQGAYRQHHELDIYGTEGHLQFVASHAGTVLRGMQNPSDTHWEILPVQGITLPQDDQDEEDWFRPGRKTEASTTYRWLEAIRTGQKSVSPDLEDGRLAQCVIDAVIRASAERRWVDVA